VGVRPEPLPRRAAARLSPGRIGLAEVPDALLRTDVLVIAGVIFALEFVVDKVPWLDSAWDAFHTAIRPLGAAAIGLLLTGEAETWQQVGAALGAGGLATAAHAAKATTRWRSTPPRSRSATRSSASRRTGSSRW
jgi:hypothetical protein